MGLVHSSPFLFILSPYLNEKRRRECKGKCPNTVGKGGSLFHGFAKMKFLLHLEISTPGTNSPSTITVSFRRYVFKDWLPHL